MPIASDRLSRLVIKLGTQLVCRRGALDQSALNAYADTVRQLVDDHYEVVLVSSGAVTAGSQELGDALENADEVSRRQVYSAAGQALLVTGWRKALGRQDLKTAQVLATRSDFRDRGHYLNMTRCMEAMLRHRVVPIVNENDTVAVTELMFTDNDELAGLLAAMVGADRLLLLTNVDGVMSDGELVDEVESGSAPRVDGVGAPSAFGRGGMASKVEVARKTAALGVEVWIANGTRTQAIRQLALGRGRGTRFRPARRPSSVKRWVASARGHEKGRIVVNPGAEVALGRPDGPTSVLPVGVTAVAGDFAKGDVIRIESERGHLLGFGKAQYGARTARKYLGKRGKRAVVHYNFLYLSERG